MGIDFNVFDQLRQHGVRAVSLSEAGHVLNVTFEDPRILGDQATEMAIAKALEDTPDGMIAKLRRIENDESLPELDRKRIATSMRDRLFYASSE